MTRCVLSDDVNGIDYMLETKDRQNLPPPKVDIIIKVGILLKPS